MTGKNMLIYAAVFVAAASLIGTGVWLHAAAVNDENDSTAASGSGGSGGWTAPSEAIANLENHGGYIYTVGGGSYSIAVSDVVSHSDGTIIVKSPGANRVLYFADSEIVLIQSTY